MKIIREALEVIKNTHGTDIFTSGGCAILAASLADICNEKGIKCEFTLMFKHFTEYNGSNEDAYDSDTGEYDEDYEDDSEIFVSLSHVFLTIGKISYDIGGDNADERWQEHILSFEKEEYGEERSEFEYETLTTNNPVKSLLEITKDYSLDTPVFPIYKEVRDSLISANSLSSPECVSMVENVPIANNLS